MPYDTFERISQVLIKCTALILLLHELYAIVQRTFQ